MTPEIKLITDDAKQQNSRKRHWRNWWRRCNW